VAPQCWNWKTISNSAESLSFQSLCKMSVNFQRGAVIGRTGKLFKRRCHWPQISMENIYQLQRSFDSKNTKKSHQTFLYLFIVLPVFQIWFQILLLDKTKLIFLDWIFFTFFQFSTYAFQYCFAFRESYFDSIISHSNFKFLLKEYIFLLASYLFVSIMV
jgi:hypothetical protein